MKLGDLKILECIDNGEIVIEPFRRECLGSNSYDVHLSKYMAVYGYGLGIRDLTPKDDLVLDAREDNPVFHFEVPDDGLVLQPGRLYLASTEEYTETHAHLPNIDGKSSTGRLGISIHETACRGDVGFCNHWTLEITVTHKVRVYAGMPIGQLTYEETTPVSTTYDKKPSAKYNGRDPLPQPSRMHRNFPRNHCLCCGKEIRFNLLVCPGLSECWRRHREQVAAGVAP